MIEVDEVPDIVTAYRNHPTHRLDERPYAINVFGIRSAGEVGNIFNDAIGYVYRDPELGWMERLFQATTDPGIFYLSHKLNPQGTALLQPGQYTYKIGEHKGRTAFVQNGPVQVLRVDLLGRPVLGTNNKPRAFEGWFGINIHRAGKVTPFINRWSAGCQVLADAADMETLLAMAYRHETLYGERIDYALFTEEEVETLVQSSNMSPSVTE